MNIDNIPDVPQVEVYDNGGKTFDRYTVIIDGDIYTMSITANMPNGVNMYLGNVLDPEIRAINPKVDKKIELTDLPKVVQEAIGNRLKAYIVDSNPDELGD